MIISLIATPLHDLHLWCIINSGDEKMNDNLLISLSRQFAVDTINLCSNINGKNVLINQILRSGTSIGANIHEGNYASSRADFINKFQIALKECYETDYWLGIFRETNIISEEDYLIMFEKCSKIRKLWLKFLL